MFCVNFIYVLVVEWFWVILHCDGHLTLYKKNFNDKSSVLLELYLRTNVISPLYPALHGVTSEWRHCNAKPVTSVVSYEL